MSDIHRKALLYHFGRSVSHGIHFDFFYSPLAAAITANGFLSAAAKEISETSKQLSDVQTVKDVEELFFRKGQLAAFATIVNLQATIEATREQAEAEEQEDIYV